MTNVLAIVTEKITIVGQLLNDSSKEKSEIETKLEHIQTSENDENTAQLQLAQIEMLKFQLRKKNRTCQRQHFR